MKKTILSIIALLTVCVCLAWNPSGEQIKTRWAQEVSPMNVLPEYPRPQMVRPEWQNLNGLWSYAILPAGSEDCTPQGEILVPFAAESSLSGVGRSVGEENALWYERSFTVPKSWKGRKVILHFGAVDWASTIWVNGEMVGKHTGGYTPFSIDITEALKKSGRQTVRVKVTDSTDNGYQPRGKQILEPSGIWYTPVTGIWQTVWLEPVSSAHIESYDPVFDISSGTLSVAVETAGAEGCTVKVKLLEGKIGYDPQNAANTVLASSLTGIDGIASFKVPEARLWSPDDPYLYGLRISLAKDGKVLDIIDGYTALRSISIVKDENPDGATNTYNRLALNGRKLFQYGPLDQGWWPDGLYTAPTDDALRYDIEHTKSWGFNMIRKHIKVEPARWYYWCDVLGMMVWQDMPSIGDNGDRPYLDPEVHSNLANKWSSDSFLGGTDCTIPEKWKQNYYKEWGEIIKSLKVFQCIVMWVPFNEAWGQFDTPQVVDFTRAQDPTRLVNAASGGNFHFVGDIQDVHHYPNPAMNAFEKSMVNVLGEYGGIGYPVDGHLWKKGGSWGYGSVMSSGKEVLDRYEHFAEMLKTFIETGCAAAVYTQTTDVEIEVNGLMTYDRVVKIDEDRIRSINQSVIAH